jgi:hypothetical protein
MCVDVVAPMDRFQDNVPPQHRDIMVNAAQTEDLEAMLRSNSARGRSSRRQGRNDGSAPADPAVAT